MTISDSNVLVWTRRPAPDIPDLRVSHLGAGKQPTWQASSHELEVFHHCLQLRSLCASHFQLLEDALPQAFSDILTMLSCLYTKASSSNSGTKVHCRISPSLSVALSESKGENGCRPSPDLVLYFWPCRLVSNLFSVLCW